ncbi:hypothetical protein TNCV_4606661 [Trichonephila clavipes]|nr:hypothetical protein TNCV_4606661 [Trichonephila clavipes]
MGDSNHTRHNLQLLAKQFHIHLSTKRQAKTISRAKNKRNGNKKDRERETRGERLHHHHHSTPVPFLIVIIRFHVGPSERFPGYSRLRCPVLFQLSSNRQIQRS